ncbi:hypothetical protein F5884DRAFT_745434 [Xylogone sp. PMI_703]|nr:hypothetical protein F5884DRAFT_745434 [Xylogone sp. PMI_703]
MQFTTLLVAASALVAGASASYSNGTVVYTTEVHTAYTTVCPAATQLTFNGQTYTVTEVGILQPGKGDQSLFSRIRWMMNYYSIYFDPWNKSTTLTITNCPCTVVKPVTTYSSVYCSTCPSSAPAPPVYVNSTTPAAPGVPTAPAPAPAGPTAPAGTAPGAPPAQTSSFVNGGNRAFAASGAGLAGLLGLAAYIL